MKWMFVGLFLAALLVGAGFLMTENGARTTFSSNSEALDLCAKGYAQVEAFRFNEGARNLEAALELDPDLAEAAISLSFANYRMGLSAEYKKSLALADSLTSQIQDNDRRMVAQMRLAVNHKSRFSSMLDSLVLRLEKEQPDNIYVMINTATLLGKKGEHELENQAWRNILEKNPNYADAYNRLGYFEMNMGNYEKAIEHMKKYAFLAPDLANPHDSLGDVLTVLGQYEDAAAEFRTAISIQPDFYFSYINLGQTYLLRGMTRSGLDIMEQVGKMLEGTELGRTVDQSIMLTYLEMDMVNELIQLTPAFVERFPKQDLSPFFRSIRLASLGRLDQSQALLDSTLTAWRSGKGYQFDPKARLNIDMAEKSYQAYLADKVDQPSTRVRHWKNLVALMDGKVPMHRQGRSRIKLAAAYVDNGEPLKAQEQIRPILEVNSRLIPALLVAVKTDLALSNAEGARAALEQLKLSIQQSDDDFKGREQAATLEALVVDLEGNS